LKTKRRHVDRLRNPFIAGVLGTVLLLILAAGHTAADDGVYTIPPVSADVFEVIRTWEVIGQNMSLAILGRDTSMNSPSIFAVDATSGDIMGLNLFTMDWVRVGGPGSQFIVADTGTLYGVTADQRVLMKRESGDRWTRMREGTRAVVGSQGGLYAIDSSTSNILAYDTASGNWTQVSGPGTQFVSGSTGHLYALAMDGSTVFRYEGTPMRWTRIGEGFQTLVAGGAKLYGVQAGSGDILEFSGTPMSWIKIGGPGKEFTADYDGQLYALSVDGAAIFHYNNTPLLWTKIGGSALTIAAGGGQLCAIDNRGDLLMYGPAVVSPLVVAATANPVFVYVPAIDPNKPSAPDEKMPIIRAQIELGTANVKHANMDDDSVRVMLNGLNVTWLDYGRDDWERGDRFKYDLNLNALQTLQDIYFIDISKTGNDGWRIDYIGLIINGERIFAKSFPQTLCLDNEGGHTREYRISRGELEGHTDWQNHSQFTPSYPFIIPRAELESRLEAIVGHQLHFHGNLRWEEGKTKWVEVYVVDDDTIEVDLDLQTNVDWVIFDEDLWIDVNFFINFACSEGRITLNVDDSQTQFGIEGSIWGTVLDTLMPFSSLLLDEVVYYIAEGLFSDFSYTYTVDTGIPICVPVWVNENGDVIIGK
jgi:hypothetical protein